jgi:molybdate transport system substrate-binding protein
MSRLHPGWLILGGSGAALAALIWLLYAGQRLSTQPPVIVHCVASCKPPLERIAAEFEALSGRQVELRYGASQTLLASLDLTRQGDVFLPADDSYLQLARDRGLIAKTWPVARMQAVLLVQAGNPLRLSSYADLLQPRIRLGQADPEAAAIGKLTRIHLTNTGQWEPLRQNTLVFKGNVNDVANAVQLNSLDAGIVWDAVASQYPDLGVIELPELEPVTACVKIAVLRTSRDPALAEEFASYAAGPAGLRHFQQAGFQVVKSNQPSSRIRQNSGEIPGKPEFWRIRLQQPVRVP